MQIIIPMSGRGSRFERAGYTKIKPLIEVEGKPIIEHVIGLFPGATDFIFICAEDHLEKTELRSVLKRCAPQGEIVSVKPHKLGPVHSVLQARAHIKKQSPAIVSYCDYSLRWDFSDFCARMKSSGCTASIPSYHGFHPHSLGPNLYAYLRVEGHRVVEIQEKGAFTDNRMQEYASAGTYYFRSGQQLLHYFSMAVEEKLLTNGEFYASLPMNLVIRDGQPVEVYELPQFLQWGTPEDLEEYKGWSSHFLESSKIKPSKKMKGTLLIPMAGLGERFQKAGFSEPKPLVPVDGSPMIKRVVDSLPKMEKRLFVCRTELELPLRRANLGVRKEEFIGLHQATDGAVTTCQAARHQIDPNAPLLIAACDSAFDYDPAAFEKLTDESQNDFVVLTFQNHPHANRNPAQYAWIEKDHTGRIAALSCKTPLSNQPSKDPGVIGTFWFRKAIDFFEAAEDLKQRDLRVNGEFYVDSIVSLLVEQGLNGVCFNVDKLLCFGTPDDVFTYEYWATYFRLRNEEPPLKALSIGETKR